MKRATLLLSGLLLAPGAAPCAALLLCQQTSGAVVARDACRRKERAVDLVAVGPLGPQGVEGTPGAAGAPGTFPLRLVDSAGAELGPILFFFPTGLFVEITNPLLGRPVTFSVSPAGFDHNRGGAISNVFYQSSDCSGVPLIRQQSEKQVIAQIYGDFAYFSAEPLVDRSFGSSETDTGGAPCSGGAIATDRGTCCSTVSGTTNSQAAVRVALSALGLTPPFRAEPR